MTNLWRGLEAGPAPPDVVFAVVESTKGSRYKFVYDLDEGTLILDRVLQSSVHYPGDFGFVPRTYCEDDEPLDILVGTTISGTYIDAPSNVSSSTRSET